eukprot:CAMPEP_0170625472 /NCGR_PEP_ID=MMETSP0224-20130122/30776_1 /TAXON_ID=285029 /ORGANISM="Togula jolla, Strain CCCM 725" /LENGTH=505 /DNA_ID=CAMNT_0010952047 /DNA_START=215 /DNA_END=1733 /DNA_ORIENTATION=+
MCTDSWILKDGLDDKVGNYLMAVHWVLGQLQGTSTFQLESHFEFSFAALVAVLGVTLIHYSWASSSALLRASRILEDLQWVELQRACRRYLKDRQVSESLALRVQKHMAAGKTSKTSGVHWRINAEVKLLEALPETLQVELHEQTRLPLLQCAHFFLSLSSTSHAAVRELCHEAISAAVILARDVCFDLGESCCVVRFIESGELRYVHSEVPSGMDSRGSRGISSQHIREVGPEDYLSEAVLWTKWEHCGSLIARRDSAMLELHADRFEAVVANHETTCLHCTRYARVFLWNLHRNLDNLSDMISTPMDMSSCEVKQDSHFIFISHFKKESGTEATLLLEAATHIICEDPLHPGSNMAVPVFIDSESLSDLSTVRHHVSMSDNLVLLLTPGFLLRPWCLVEVATAAASGANIVPVLVQRPGIEFVYPEEAYYSRLLSGSALSATDMNLLSSEGVALDVLVSSLRQVFRQIALPFSPHKSANIRQAELKDILNRCASRPPSPSVGG